MIEKVDLLACGGVRVRESGGMTDGIDGDTLGGIGRTAENQIGAAEENRTGASRGATSDTRPQEVGKGCAAGDLDREHAVEVDASGSAA